MKWIRVMKISCLKQGGKWVISVFLKTLVSSPTSRASDRSQKKVKFRGVFRDKFAEESANFAGIFGANFAEKQSVKKRQILWLFSRQISLEIDWFCTDQTSFFNIFLTEVIICSFNNNTLQKWTNGKAFNIMASAQIFTTQFTPGSFGTLFAWFSDEVPR